MRDHSPLGRKVTPHDIIFAALGVAAMVVPLLLVIAVPERPWVKFLFGGYKILLAIGLSWAVVFSIEHVLLNKPWYKSSWFSGLPQRPDCASDRTDRLRNRRRT